MHLSLLALALVILAGDAHAQERSSTRSYRKLQTIGREARSSLLDDPGFRIEQLDLDVFDLATASALEGPEAMQQLPASDSPIGAVLRLAHCYALGRVAEYGMTMTEDFRYLFAEAGLVAKHPDGFRREDEMRSLEHLVRGFVDAAGIERPRARSMRLRFDRIESSEDPEFPEDRMGHAMIRVRAQLEITLETGERLGAFDGIQLFSMVRGDRAHAPEGARRDADHWFVRRWRELAIEDESVAAMRPESPSAGGRRPAAPSGRSEEERGSTSDARREEEPLRFSLAVPASIQRGAVQAVVTLAVAEQARLDLYDVVGRRVASSEIAGREPGRFEVRVASRETLASGVYWLRLVQGPRTAIARVNLLN